MSTHDELLSRLDKEAYHYVCEDCWYSCPASGECCDDRQDDTCNCGANTENILRKDAATAIRTLELENNKLRETLLDLAQYAADEIGVPLNECISGPIGKARAILQKTGGTNV